MRPRRSRPWVPGPTLLRGPSTSPLDAPVHTLSPVSWILAAFLLGGCTEALADLDADTRAEEAAVRTLVHREDSFEAIYKTLTARGYECSDQKTLDGGRIVVCSKNIGSEHFCFGSVLVQRVKTHELDNFDIHALYKACH